MYYLPFSLLYRLNNSHFYVFSNIKRPTLSAITRGDCSKVYVKTSRCYDSDTYNHTCRRNGKNSFLYQKREDVPTYLINHTTDSGSVGGKGGNCFA